LLLQGDIFLMRHLAQIGIAVTLAGKLERLRGLLFGRAQLPVLLHR
jgi:hypothetical protein